MLRRAPSVLSSATSASLGTISTGLLLHSMLLHLMFCVVCSVLLCFVCVLRGVFDAIACYGASISDAL